jgi:gamma-glutamylcyclotransferase (GGCT)/AIG2-like uncharacterized protein YtfP
MQEKLMAISLFSYGTLQQPEVQLANYGRLLAGTPDALRGHRLVPLEITDPHVIEVSGKAVHTIACASGLQEDRIEGMVFEITDQELAATDAYEVDVYARVEVALESGRKAWVYVGQPDD